MKAKIMDSKQIRDEFFERYPALKSCEETFDAAYQLIITCYKADGKLMLAGNGGSAADSDHFAGEMTKSFKFDRRVDDKLKDDLEKMYGEEGKHLADNLEGGLQCIPLTQFISANTAFANDSPPEATFAQLVQIFGRKNDVFIGITTSGNSKNIILAFMAAKARGVKTICLTGKTGGKCKAYADVSICVPETETFKIQEYHLPLYHALCSMVEADFFDAKT